jgi:hypothetical protein
MKELRGGANRCLWMWQTKNSTKLKFQDFTKHVEFLCELLTFVEVGFLKGVTETYQMDVKLYTTETKLNNVIRNASLLELYEILPPTKA